MSQLTRHQIHSIEDKIIEGYNNSQISKFIGKDRSVLFRLFQQYPREWFTAEKVIEARFHKKSWATKKHQRIQLWGELSLYIDEKFRLDWSADQITESWKQEQKAKLWKYTSKISLSKDTVYDWIYTHYSKEELKKHLRRKYKAYRDRKQEAAMWWKYQMWEQVRIEERTKKYPDVGKRDETGKRIEELGHWEGDTIIGKERKWAILTLVERSTWQTLIGELPLGKNAIGVSTVLKRLFSHIPKEKIKSLTFDNGREFADHKMLWVELKLWYGILVDIYFAHPYHSWERWSNENTNWLIRQYLPKKTDFSNITQKDLDKIQTLLNSRPRKRLNYATPQQMFWWNNPCCVSD